MLTDTVRPRGCDRCRTAWRAGRHEAELEVVLDHEVTRQVFEQEELYQYDRVFRCPACNGLWLGQWIERDTPETALMEWGIVESRVIPLGEADLQTILDSVGKWVLPRDHFLSVPRR